jgi:hypothetical protein
MTIIDFLHLVANLLNRPTDGATVSVRKNAFEKVAFRPHGLQMTDQLFNSNLSFCVACVFALRPIDGREGNMYQGW